MFYVMQVEIRELENGELLGQEIKIMNFLPHMSHATK